MFVFYLCVTAHVMNVTSLSKVLTISPAPKKAREENAVKDENAHPGCEITTRTVIREQVLVYPRISLISLAVPYFGGHNVTVVWNDHAVSTGFRN